MPDTFQVVGDPRTPERERRQWPRQRVLFSFMHLENDNGAIILDISEHGLSMQAVRNLNDDHMPRIRFLLSQLQPWVETRARIAWISASKKTAGVEFIGLSDEARNQIKQWISLELQLNEPVKDNPAIYEPENVIPFSEPETTGRVPEKQSISEDAVEVPPRVEKVLPYSWVCPKRADSSRASGQLIALAAGTTLLLSTLFLLVYHFPKSTHSHPQMQTLLSTKAPEPSTDTSVSPTNSPVDQTPLSGRPGFMLQVGAMKHKENADALAEVLRQRNLPAFVSPRGTDRFYRVLVGPYGDADSTLRAKEELKGEGFDSIRTPWDGEGFESARTLWKTLTGQAPHSADLR
jgi:septal ring-binding cell division protein DamX